MAVPAVLSDLGVRPHRAFAASDVDPRLFRDPDTRIPLEDVGRLFETCVQLTGCNHFGLLVGARFDLGGFGPLGLLLRNSASVGDAVRSLLLHLHLHDRGAAPVLLAPTPSSMLLGYSVYRRETPAIPQIYDAAMAIAYRILRELVRSHVEATKGPVLVSQTQQHDAIFVNCFSRPCASKPRSQELNLLRLTFSVPSRGPTRRYTKC